MNDYIDVVTYQSIEERIKNGKWRSMENLKAEYRKYSYIVYDECHYFAVDSIYNTSTQLSYDFLTECFFDKTQIYISATMNCVRERIIKSSFNFHNMYMQYYEKNRQMEIYEYLIEKEYSYIHINTFNDISHLKEIILSTIKSYNSKWLIFVESIKEGKNLQKQLEESDNKIHAEDVVFIDAKFEQDEDAAKSVLELDEKKLINKKVVIATSVLDNGVSFQDIMLRNIVVTADNKESFIQMLGRKRKDQDIVELFIQRRNEAFFTRRYQSIGKVLKTYDRFEKDFQNLYSNDENTKLDWQSCIIEPQFSFSAQLKPKKQQNMLKTIMNNSETYEHFKKFAFVLGGFLALNDISINRLMRLRIYYKEVAQELAKDPDAFLKLQLNWLGITGDEGEKIARNCVSTEGEYYVRKIKEHIESILYDSENNVVLEQRQLDKEACTMFKNGMKNERQYIISNFGKSLDSDKIIRELKRNDRPITAEHFNTIMEIKTLLYNMTGTNPYVISRK